MDVFSLEQLKKSGKKITAYNDKDNILVMVDQKARTYYSPHGENWKLIQTQELLTKNKNSIMLKLNHGFSIDADDVSFTLYEDKIRYASKEHKTLNEGDEYVFHDVCSYHTKLGNALNSYMNILVARQINKEEHDMKSIIDFINKTKEEILQIAEL